MVEQEFDLTPKRKQRRFFWLLSGCGALIVILLCAGGAITMTKLLLQRVQDEPADAEVADAEVLDVLEEVVVEDPQGGAGRGRIGYIDLAGRMNTVAADGSERRLLADGEDRLYRFPTWSPDSKQLAAVGSTQSGSGVYLFSDQPAAVNGGPGEPDELYYSSTEGPFYLYWSPDGRQISFLANHPDGIGLHLAPVDSSGDSRLLATGSPFYWEWLRGGDELLFHSGLTGAGARLAFLDDNSEESGTNIAQPGYFQAPGISQGGRYLAYAEVDEAEERWLVVHDREQDERQQIAHSGMVALGWSPTGDELAFISPGPANPMDGGYFGPLQLLDAATGQVQTLTEKVVLAFFWAPDGHALAYLTVADPRDELQAFEETTKEARPRSGKPAQQREGPLRLNLWVTEIASGETTLLLAFEPNRLYLEQFLPFFDQYALSHRIWAPDSTELVLPLVEDDTAMIYVVPLEGEPRQIAEGSIAFWSYR